MQNKDIAATGRSGRFLLLVCLLLVLQNGCAIFPQKRVAPPPARPIAGKAPAPAASPAVTRKFPVARAPGDERYIAAKPPVDRPFATEPTIDPTIEERTLPPEPPGRAPSSTVDTPAVEGPLASIPPAGERPMVTGPAVEERPIGERPAAEPPGEEPGEAPGASADYQPVTGKAAAIYNQAEKAMQAGNYPSAELLLERALRIEPRNGHYWYSLGLAKFRQKQYAQAVQFCLKAESLAGSQPGLIARNQVLLTHAKKAAGMK